jgi:hypothetical protein
MASVSAPTPNSSIFYPTGPLRQGFKSAQTALAAEAIAAGVLTGPAAPAAWVVLALPTVAVGFTYGLLKGYAQQTKAKYQDTFVPAK